MAKRGEEETTRSEEETSRSEEQTARSEEQAQIEELVGEKPTRGALRRDWKLLPRVLPYLRPYRKFAVLSVLCTIALALVVLAEPWPIAFVIDSVLGTNEPPGWVTGIFGDRVGVMIALAVGATLLLTALSGGLTVINEYLATTVDQRMVLDLRSEMFQHAQRLSLAFHDTERTGILMYRINQQASAVGRIVTGLPQIAQAVLTIVGMGYVTYRIDPLLALIALAVVPFIFYSTTFYTDRIEPRLYRVRGLEGINLSIVHESMQMMRVVLAFGHEKREYGRFREQGEQAVDARIDLTVRQTAFKLGVQMITAVGTAAVLGIGAYRAINGHISPGELIVVLTYITQVYTPLEQLTTTIAAFQQDFIAVRHALDLLDTAPEVVEKPDARAVERVRGEIELESVSFNYPRRPGVLRDVSLRVPAGEAVALVGPTGAGKSTLVSLLPRFYNTSHGRVLLDGTDITDLKLDSLRAQFSIVLQEPLLFSGTILDNISYGKPDASDEEVREAARLANAHEFISRLPDGYETMLGERGAKISGGERQRIAVARAFLRDAPILMLDEPTSAIDSETESVILEALERLMEGRTTIMIAHRLSTLRAVDQILVLNEGRVEQRGRHDQLVAQPGLYRRLWQAQAGAPDKELPAGPRQAAKLPAPSRAGPPSPSPAELPAPAPVAELPAPNADPGGEVAGGRGDKRAKAAREGNAAREGEPAALPKPKIVLLGMLSKIPLPGPAWLVGHYAVGFERLGYEVYYVEAHARTPTMFIRDESDDGSAKAARFVAGIAERFGLEDRWAFQAMHEDGHCYGMSAERLDRLYRDAALIVNMHGGTLPLPEHAATDRLVFLGTDPVAMELRVQGDNRRAIELLEQHTAFFSWGLNFGNPDCRLPWATRFPFVASPPPVVLDLWDGDTDPSGPFTTIGNWRQPGSVRFEGRDYSWSKHQRFLKILDLPRRAGAPIELALASYDDHDRLVLAEHGWRVRPAAELFQDLDSYRDYIVGSAGELSVAKEQNVHFRSGWFSERSATYLAAGRPVILEDTGFAAALPTGEGLFTFADLAGAVDAIAAVMRDPARHRGAAREVAREYLSHEVVLGDMLDHVGLRPRARRRTPRRSPAPVSLPEGLSLEASSRDPLQLPDKSAEAILDRPIPAVPAPAAQPVATVVVPVVGDLAWTRLALEGLLSSESKAAHEVVVVDNASAEPIRKYLEVLAARNRHVRVIRNERNIGFGAACNQGLAAAKAEILVLLHGDVIVTPGWLRGLSVHLDDPAIGLVGAATNRSRGDAQVEASYATYGEMLRFADRRREQLAGNAPRDMEVPDMFCVALRRELFEEVGPLDEGLGTSRLEDDYARRVREAGHRIACADEVFVHRIGEAEPPAEELERERARARALAEKLEETERRLAENERRGAAALEATARRLEEAEARAAEAEARAARAEARGSAASVADTDYELSEPADLGVDEERTA
jgi:ATP-binding cassette, subfamily B, bacterial